MNDEKKDDKIIVGLLERIADTLDLILAALQPRVATSVKTQFEKEK